MTDTLYIFYNQKQEFICQDVCADFFVSNSELDMVYSAQRKDYLEAAKRERYWENYNINIDDFIITPIQLNFKIVSEVKDD